MIKTEGLTHIHLMVRTLERSLRFYQDVFGMKELFRDGPAMVFLNTPGSRDSITLNARSLNDRGRWSEWRHRSHRISPGGQVQSGRCDCGD